MRDLREKYASQFGVPDGGRYANDWASRIDSVLEQLEALRDAAERVVAADNQSLGAMGEEGRRAEVEIIDALHALRLVLDSYPASEPN